MAETQEIDWDYYISESGRRWQPSASEFVCLLRMLLPTLAAVARGENAFATGFDGCPSVPGCAIFTYADFTALFRTVRGLFPLGASLDSLS